MWRRLALALALLVAPFAAEPLRGDPSRDPAPRGSASSPAARRPNVVIYLVDTLRSLAAQQDLQASAEGAVASNLVQVYKSLGGGWEVRGGQDPVDLLPDTTKDEMRQRVPRSWKDILD